MAEAVPLAQALERTAPHDIDAEEGLLAACIIEGGHEILADCLQAGISPDSFYRPAHRLIFEALMELVKDDKVSVDEIILADKLRVLGHLDEAGGFEGLNRLTGRIETTVHANYWMEIVQEKAMRRGLIKACTVVVEDCYQPVGEIGDYLEKIEQDIFNLRNDRGSTMAEPFSGPVEAASQLIQRLINKESVGDGIKTGFDKLDRMTQGFQPGQMIVLAARPSVGKTSLAMNFTENVVCPRSLVDPVPTLVFSLEMTSEQLAYRMLCSRANVDMARLRDGFASRQDQTSLGRAANELKAAPMWIDDASSISIYEMKAKARRLNSSRKNRGLPALGLIVIDYLQLITSFDRKASREQQIAEISRAIKGMSKDLNLPVVVLSQLNRDMEKEKRDPRLSDLRESGAIEQDADVVILLNRQRYLADDVDGGEDGDGHAVQGPLGMVDKIKLIIAKQRNGPVGEFLLAFLRKYTRFENLEESD